MKLLSMAIGAALATLSASAEASYRCEVMAVTQLGANGKLVKPDWAKMVRNLDEVIIFDSASGLFRYQGESGAYEFSVLQMGSSVNAMKAARIQHGSGSAVMETIQIQSFAENEFIYVAGDLVRTGQCETL